MSNDEEIAALRQLVLELIGELEAYEPDIAQDFEAALDEIDRQCEDVDA
jgi:hypothetical protein